MRSLLSAALYTLHLGQVSSRGLCPRVWKRFAGGDVSPNGNDVPEGSGWDFNNFAAIAPGVAGAVSGSSGDIAYYTDTVTAAGSVVPHVTARNVASVLASTQDNAETWIGSNGCQVIQDGSLLAFEARIRIPTLDNATAFVGLATPGSVATNFVVDSTEALKDADILGFHYRGTDSGSLKFAYRKLGGSVVYIDLNLTPVANAWYRVGFVLDPAEQSGQRLSIFVDNILVGEISAADVGGSAFPSAAPMGLIAGLKNNSASARTLDLGFIYTSQ